ncbi:hypothetical protein Trydic_g3205 [Trypoxylus dichotomus]
MKKFLAGKHFTSDNEVEVDCPRMALLTNEAKPDFVFSYPNYSSIGNSGITSTLTLIWITHAIASGFRGAVAGGEPNLLRKSVFQHYKALPLGNPAAKTAGGVLAVLYLNWKQATPMKLES